MKNTYFNSRAIAPVFTDSSHFQAEGYIGQGVRQIGGNISFAPIRQAFVTGTYNHGAGSTWEAGLGIVPFKRNDFSLTFLGTYGRGHVDYSYKKDLPYEEEQNTNIDSKYEKYSSTAYVKLKDYGQFFICLGFRYNFVQYFKYKEHMKYYRDIPKETYYKGEDSLSFDGLKNFHTIDPFVDFHCHVNKHISLSFQTLYSFSSKFSVNGKGYKNTSHYSSSKTQKQEYSYTTTIPQYKRLVLNFAVILHLGSKKKTS